MKSVLLAMIVVLMSLASVSCQNSKAKVKEMIKQVRSEMPLDMGMVGKMTSASYDEANNEVVMTITFSKDLPVKPSDLYQVKNTLKRQCASEWAKNRHVRDMFKSFSKAQASLTLVMQNAERDDKMKLNLSSGELEKIAKGNVDKLSPREILAFMATCTNVQCPMQIDEATVLSSVSLEGDDFVYSYSFDEDIIDMDLLESNMKKAKAELMQTLKSADPTVVKIVLYCKAAHVNFRHRYVGNETGKSCSFKIMTSELYATRNV